MDIYFLNQTFSTITQDFVDIVLSKTQRKTPTVIHKNYQIGRIREFYTRKIKFTQQTFHDKLNQIINDFPKLDVSLWKCNYYWTYSDLDFIESSDGVGLILNFKYSQAPVYSNLS